MRASILGVRGELAPWDLHQSKAHPRFPNTSKYKVLLYLPPYGRNSDVKLGPHQFDPPLGWLGWTNGSKMVPFEISSPHSCRPILHRLATVHNAADRHDYRRKTTDRQSDRNRRKRHLVAFRLKGFKRTSHTNSKPPPPGFIPR